MEAEAVKAEKLWIYDVDKIQLRGTAFDMGDIGPEMKMPDVPEGQKLIVVFSWERGLLAVDVTAHEMFEAFKRQYLRGNVFIPIFFLISEEKLEKYQIMLPAHG